MMEDNKNSDKESQNQGSFLDDILGNAISSTKKHEETKADLETKSSKSCGAARPAETNLKYCDYCGNEFY